MSLENNLDSFHARVKQNRPLQYFAAFNRVILAVSFIPSGMTKLLGNRFTQLPLDNPVGFFFEAFYQTGGWYRFVGFAQVLAAILLLIPRTSTLGATIFFPIVLNIAIITYTVGFKGTWVITALMFLANMYLICWDYDKFKPLLPFDSDEHKQFDLKKSLPLTILGAIGGVLAYGLFAMLNPSFKALGIFGGVAGFIAGGIVGLLNSWQLQKK
jgi:uncharacterized membrane protein YphA (DoxX/SURF4 family)